MTLSLDDALSSAEQIKPNRRALVALIDETDIHWWGGHIDRWKPDKTLFSSNEALKGYWKLLTRFKKGQTVKANVLMVHNDGTFGAVMLGVESLHEAQELLDEALEEIRMRSSD